jgi:hypothetical protein
MKKNIIRNCTLGYSCDQNWNELDNTDVHKIRFCNSCQREVHWCENEGEIMQNITLNRSIGFERSPSQFNSDAIQAATKRTKHAPMAEPDFDFDDDIPF